MTSPTAQNSAAAAPAENQDRSRLLDHFKRVFAILVGLAITEACRKLLPVAPRFEPPVHCGVDDPGPLKFFS